MKPGQVWSKLSRADKLGCLFGMCWLLGVGLCYNAVGLEMSSPSLFHPPASTVVFGVSAVLGSLGGLLYTIPSLTKTYDERPGDLIGFVYGIIGTFLVVPSAFTFLCHDLYLQYGGFVTVGAPIHLTDYEAWGAFSISWVLDGITFNASQVFNWLPAPIQPVAWWSGLLVVAFSFVIDVVLFASIVNFVRTLLALVPQTLERKV